MYFISLACVGDFYGFRLNLLCAVAEVNLLDWLQLCLLESFPIYIFSSIFIAFMFVFND